MIRPVFPLLAAALAFVATVASAQTTRPRPVALTTAPVAQPGTARPTGLLSTVTLADLNLPTGLRFSNLGGRREIFVPLPQGADLSVSEIALVLDDITAHDARRSLEILVNDRSAAAIALDGRGLGRTVRVPLARAGGRNGFLKLGFIYSGAATQDRCIDVRYIGDSLTVRPETALEIEIGSAALDIATTAALMPRDVAVVVSGQTLAPADLATALTVGRTLKASGRRVSFHHGFAMLLDLTRRDDTRRWTRGLVLIGASQEIAPYVEMPAALVAGPPAAAAGTLAVARAGGLPAIVVTDADAVRAGRLFASPQLPATRGASRVLVGDGTARKTAARRVTFDELALAPDVAEVFGRADIAFAIPTKALPAGTRPSRLALDLMVAPDGAGEKAVVSVFVNDRLLGSTVAAVGEPTRLDLELPSGLVGTDLNVRTLVQRRSAQGDCRFEPQGYPAQILGSSAIVVVDAGDRPKQFADLAAWWSDGIEVWLPSPAVERPAPLLGLITAALAGLSPATAPVTVKFIGGQAPAPSGAFIAVSQQPPAGAAPRVQFDRGRVAVADRDGKTLLDVGGFTGGAVAQIVMAGAHPGLWFKPLAADATLPSPAELRLDRGDVAFVDRTGIALALSSERDALVRIVYPDQVSWVTVAGRFKPWIVGALWLLATVGFLFLLQRMLRRRSAAAQD